MITHSASLQLLTDHKSGHTLNRRQVFSPDRQWCVFDSRNHDSEIGTTRSIARVQLANGDIEQLYSPPRSSPFGPGVGAAAYHPHEHKIVFIHGLTHCDESNPYGAARRFGAILDLSTRRIAPMESRVARAPVPAGSLSGGSHAHSWSPSGKRISFTYNDALSPHLGRTVGFCDLSLPPPNATEQDAAPGESFQGSGGSYLLLTCSSEGPIQQALEECWIDEDRIAFLGFVPSNGVEAGRWEVFIARLPGREGLQRREDGSALDRDLTIEVQTDLSKRTFPGVQGPRHWLVADLRGEWVYSLWRDERGKPQIFRVQTRTGETETITELASGVEDQFALSPSGKRIAFISEGSIHSVEIATKKVLRLNEVKFMDRSGKEIPPPPFVGPYIGAPHFIDETSWLVNRYLQMGEERFLQIVRVVGGGW